MCNVGALLCGWEKRHKTGGDISRDKSRKLTLDFERTPPVASIQMYSAIALPFWSSFMYFINCAGVLELFN